MKHIRYSVVFPVYNEAQGLTQLTHEVVRVMDGKRYEIIAVNDGSTDASLSMLKEIEKSTPSLQVIHLPTRLGKWSALILGIKKAQGDIIITLDSDLQDDPGQLPVLFHALKKDTDVSSGWRKGRMDPWYKVTISHLGNLFVSYCTGRVWHDLNAPMKVYRRGVFATIPLAGSLLRFSLLFASKTGFRVVEVPIKHRPRVYGNSKFGLIKYLRILYDTALVLLLFTGSGSIRKTSKKLMGIDA